MIPILKAAMRIPTQPGRAGTYVSQLAGYRAFVPRPLPPDPAVQLSGELQALLSRSDRALGRLDSVGTLTAGKRCDLAVWNIERPAELVYRMGFNPLHARVWGGI